MSMEPSEFEETDQIFCNSHFNSFEFDGWIEDHSLNIYNFDSDGDTYFHRVNLASPVGTLNARTSANVIRYYRFLNFFFHRNKIEISYVQYSWIAADVMLSR